MEKYAKKFDIILIIIGLLTSTAVVVIVGSHSFNLVGNKDVSGMVVERYTEGNDENFRVSDKEYFVGVELEGSKYKITVSPKQWRDYKEGDLVTVRTLRDSSEMIIMNKIGEDSNYNAESEE